MSRRPRITALVRWLPFAVVAVNLLLWSTGVVDGAQAALLVVVLEASLLAVVLAEFAAMRVVFRRARSRGAGRAQAALVSLDACLPPGMAFLVRQELTVMLALPRLLRRSPRIPDTTTVRAAGPVPVLSCAVLALAVPGCVLSPLVGGPGWLSWVLFGVSLYAACYALGLWALHGTEGHLVGRTQLRVRHGATTDLGLPLTGADSARVDPRTHRGGPVSVDGDTLTVALFGRTNVTVGFAHPVRAEFPDRDPVEVTRVRFFADAPEAAVAAIGAALPRKRP
ncbi:hypothetical protein DFP74_3131 [Nocardiopsis sp. Huas11]|uniref:hypothetical protein n=1 Tax=Nocardiopsis sp. Huas11 TaxID=2183912 RepID=UPI000EACDEAA|nr:hypothetical protein [Nocardiopsis sp. Huas11]RKS07461.1 hypothetical protein DFP74_3131 [Nocardiopsis sp. Huas11]